MNPRSLLMAQSRAEPCPHSGVKRTLIGRAPMSANDPKQASAAWDYCRAT
jgi:hypothetical protein